jgi:translocator protein
MMAIAVYLVWKQGWSAPLVRTGMILFAVQLVLNCLWSFLFFGMRNPLAGLVEIVLLWAALLVTIIYFLPVSRPAGFLLIPYILWVSFATALNAAIAFLNRPS